MFEKDEVACWARIEKNSDVGPLQDIMKLLAVNGQFYSFISHSQRVTDRKADNWLLHEDEFYVPGKNASTHTETKGRDEVFIPCEIVKDYPTVDRDAIEKNLNIGRKEYFFSTNNSKKHFQKQWKEIDI